MADFSLREPVVRTREVAEELVFLNRNSNRFRTESQQLRAQLNEEQSLVFDTIYSAITQHALYAHMPHTMFFVEGRPGCFLIKALAASLRAQSLIVLIAGTSALSAVAYERGRTAHYLFGIPVTDDNTDVHSSVPPHSPHADLIREACTIIWDELPMANKASWECAHQLCCRIMQHFDVPFGGKIIIGSGDFGQVAPVVPGCGEIASLTASVKTSPLWTHMFSFSLHTPICTITTLTSLGRIPQLLGTCFHC